MTAVSSVTTATGLLARATALLKDGGYKVIAGQGEQWGSGNSRLFEDAYNIVGVVVFESCAELLDSWPEQQESLVKVISEHVAASEAKAWDGYLVLLTPGRAPSERERLKKVRCDMTRLRKLIATGDDLEGDADVERILRPLLPLTTGGVRPAEDSSLSLLPKLLADESIPESVTRALVDAFSKQTSLMERLHEAKRRK